LKTSKLGAEAAKSGRGGVEFIQFPRLADPQVLQHAVSTRVGGVSRGNQGSLNISFKVQDDPVRVQENRDLLSRALGMDLSRAVGLDQVHSDRVLSLDAANLPSGGGNLGEGDGLITRLEGVPILILVADCLPVLFFDPVHKAIGLAHAGWRGTIHHGAAKTLGAMGEA
jgi:polyphenol oxidase